MTVRSGYVVLCCACCVGVMEDLEKEKEKEKLPMGIGTTLSDRTHLVDPSRILKRLPFLGRYVPCNDTICQIQVQVPQVSCYKVNIIRSMNISWMSS